MVKICETTYPEGSDFEEHFNMFPYPLSDFQKYAIEGIVLGHHTLVTAHTGSGKTLPAEFAIQHFTQQNKKVIYCSPIKSLSNQKFYEFSKKYPHISFGIFTGDIKSSPEAQVLICTTEILCNYLFTGLTNFELRSTFVDPKAPTMSLLSRSNSDRMTTNNLGFQIDIQTELGAVVFDEVHFINDKERGQVWEKTILMLPEHIQMVMLSATIDNPQGFAKWIEDRYPKDHDGSKQVYLASTNHRVVPLTHYGFMTTVEGIFKTVKDKDMQRKIKDVTNVLVELQDASGKWKEEGYKKLVFGEQIMQNNRVHINRKHTMNQLALFLRDHEMLPAIAFVFSRKNVEAMAKEVTIPLLEDDSKVPYIVARECEQVLRKLPNYQEYMQLPEYMSLVSLLEKGIGIHHSGMIPVLREIVELMISKRYIKLLFATESFAIGLDCPIKTAIFTSLTKFDGQNERHLMAHEYTQMAGRAGRRGIDTVGHVVHCNNLFSVPTMNEYKTVLGGVPQTLVSKFHISYPLVLNLLKNDTSTLLLDDIYAFCEKSMMRVEIDKTVSGIQQEIDVLKETIDKKRTGLALLRTPEADCREYILLEDKWKTSVNKKRKECERAMQVLRDQHKTLLLDIVAVRDMTDHVTALDHEYYHLKNNTYYIHSQVEAICHILCKKGFVTSSQLHLEDVSIEYKLTTSGTVAASLAEVHPLIMATLLTESNWFETVSSQQLIGLLSCFTDVKVADDERITSPTSCCDDTKLAGWIQRTSSLCDEYEKVEQDMGTDTGIHYDNMLMFDMVQYSMDWTRCTTEQECKYFIQAVISERGISVGDFTKAMMKIVTIARELENVCETVGEHVELLFKLRQMEGMVLKYVLTSQSLYL